MDYCRTTMAHRPTEQFRVFYLDRKNTLIADEEQAQGTVDHVPVYPREVVKRALLLNASALILVHNHPSGDPTPSEADISMTEQIKPLADGALGLTLHDHIIIGKSAELSFRAEGYVIDSLTHPDLDPPVHLPAPGAVVTGHRHRLAKGLDLQPDPIQIGGLGRRVTASTRTASARRSGDLQIGIGRSVAVAEPHKNQPPRVIKPHLHRPGQLLHVRPRLRIQPRRPGLEPEGGRQPLERRQERHHPLQLFQAQPRFPRRLGQWRWQTGRPAR